MEYVGLGCPCLQVLRISSMQISKEEKLLVLVWSLLRGGCLSPAEEARVPVGCFQGGQNPQVPPHWPEGLPSCQVTGHCGLRTGPFPLPAPPKGRLVLSSVYEAASGETVSFKKKLMQEMRLRPSAPNSPQQRKSRSVRTGKFAKPCLYL